MSPISKPVAPLQWTIKQFSVGGQTFFAPRVRLDIFLPTGSRAGNTPETAWLDTGAPVSVVPFHIHIGRLRWHALNAQVTWQGQRCTMGRIDIWLPGSQPGQYLGPLPLLAKFAHADPPGPPIPILLGLEFQLVHHATLHLPPHPLLGSLLFP